jgi:hypothetical protein
MSLSAVAEIMQNRYSVNADSSAGNAALAMPNVGHGCQQGIYLGTHISHSFQLTKPHFVAILRGVALANRDIEAP